MRKSKLLHLGKLLLILLLIVSAVLLARESGYYDRFFHRLPSAGGAQSESAENKLSLSSSELAAAVIPRAVLVCSGDSVCTASAYGGEETETEFHRFSAILGEALGSAGEPTEISEQDFRTGLEGGCVYFDFFCETPLELLAAWLGSSMTGTAAAAETHAVCLGLSDLTVQLCYADGAGHFYRCTTAAMSETLSARMAEFQGSNADFAYSDKSLHNIDTYTVILSVLPELPSVGVASVRDAIDAAALMQTLGMNSFVASGYAEADGTKVYIDNEKTLRIGSDGTVTFRADTAEADPVIAEGLPAAVSYAYAVCQRSIGAAAGDASVLFTGAERSPDEGYTVTFDYCIGTVPLQLPADNAAKIVIRNGQLAEAQMTLRSYTYTEDTETVLPMLQAAAIADAEEATPTLVYVDSGDRVSCAWVRN